MERNHFFSFFHKSIINHSAGEKLKIPLSALIIPPELQRDSIFESVQIIKENLLKIQEKIDDNFNVGFTTIRPKRIPSFSPEAETLLIHIKKLMAPTIFYIEGAGNKSANEEQIMKAHSMRKRLFALLRRLQSFSIIDESFISTLLPPVRKEEE